MARQMVMVVAIPAGIDAGGGRVRLSLVVSPRLRDGATLRDFPDFTNWTERLADGARIVLDAGAGSIDAALDPAVLQPALWPRIFPPDVPVRSYATADYDNRLIVSYPVAAAEAAVKNTYQRIGTRYGHTLPPNEVLFQNAEAFGLGLHRDRRVLDDLIVSERISCWREQQSDVGRGRPRRSARIAAVSGSRLSDTTRVEPLDTATVRQAARRFALFHSMPQPADPPPLPDTDDELAELLDFHAALTALHAYPALMRKLGLIIDVHGPIGRVPLSPPPAGDHGSLVVVEFEPEARWEIAPERCFPRTAYVRRDASPATATLPARPAQFLPAPVTPLEAGEGPAVHGDVVDGLVGFTPDTFRLVRVDVDGVMHKMLALADNTANAGGAEPAGGLPALRSGGFSVILLGRAACLRAAIEENKGLAGAFDSGAAARPLTALDVLRGFRVDVKSSRTGIWESLHRRRGEYLAGADDPLVVTVIEEEGFVQPAVAQPAPSQAAAAPAGGVAPPPGSDLYAHERLARWNGWSLSVPPLGKALNRSSDPALALADDPSAGQPRTPFKLETTFTVIPRSLPALRFGTRYRVRLRAVDIAGNSITRAEANQLEGQGLESPEVAYLRYEPVAAPDVVLRNVPLRPGESLMRLVIRSFNAEPAGDTAATTETVERHIVPPRAAQLTVEQHGMIDAPDGRLRGDAATYAMLAERDNAKIALVDVGDSAHTEVPIEEASTFSVPYLPDPLARAAALRGLPGIRSDSVAEAAPAGVLRISPRPQPDPDDESVLHVDFQGTWPDVESFRLTLAEGQGPPQWDAVGRELRVRLPKAGVVRASLSSVVTDSGLQLMAVWQWLLEYLDAEQNDLIGRGDAHLGVALTEVAHRRSHLTRLAREGSHWMLTPAHEVAFVHAVQQPLGRPFAIPLDVDRVPQAFPQALWFDVDAPLSAYVAWREQGSRDAFLSGGLRVHGASTAKIDLGARWIDPVDDPAMPGPATSSFSSPVDEVPLPEAEDGDLEAPGPEVPKRLVGRYVKQADVIWFGVRGQRLRGHELSRDAAPRHRLPDTKHRTVRYRAIATSRFREYFENDPQRTFTRESEEIAVSIPSSSRPLAPDVLYVLPTFGWERETTTNVQTSVRVGRGLRIYLERPWFSSGEGELLGVVLLHEPGEVSDLRRVEVGPYITQWGLDPIWAADAIPALPYFGSFPDRVATGHQLTLEQTASVLVDVAGHDVRFDADRRQWYCDITVDLPFAYSPFVRLALARYQPRSIPGVELSRVVLADFVQLAPDRAAVVTTDASDPLRLRLVVAGAGHNGPERSGVRVTVERRRADVLTDLGWEPAPAAVASVVADVTAPNAPFATRWSGIIQLAKAPAAGELRIVVREYEFIERDAQGLAEFARALRGQERLFGERLVYADIIPIAPTSEPAVAPLAAGDPDEDSDIDALDLDRMRQPDPEPESYVPPWDPMPDPPLPAALDPAGLPDVPAAIDPEAPNGFVKLAQALLNASGVIVGAPLPVHGLYDAETSTAVQNFQATRFIDAAGNIDGITWFSLLPLAPLAILQPDPGGVPMQGPPIAMLQQILNQAGRVAELEMTGVFDAATSEAVSDFQADRGFVSTGIVDPATWLALFDAAREPQPTGTVRLTFQYDSEWWEAGEAPVRHIGTEGSEDLPMPSDSRAPIANASGFWMEWQDGAGRVLYRQIIPSPIQLEREVLTEAPEFSHDVVLIDHPAGTFQVVVPVYGEAETFAIFSSPLDADHANEAASLIASFSADQLL